MATILLIDDSHSMLSLAEQILTEAGHTVISRRSAHRLASVIATQIFDLVITDIYMPDKDGLEVIVELGKLSPQTPVIAMTGGLGIRDMRAAAKTMGAALTIHKPLSAEQLLEAVNSVLANSVDVGV